MRSPGLSPVVRTVARFLAPFLLLYGIYLVAYGHTTPGGGFPGGVVVAGGFMMLVLALGRSEAERALPRGVAGVLKSVGALAFLTIALLGLRFGEVGREGVFFLNFIQKTHPGRPHELMDGGIIPLAEAAIAVLVAMSFAAVFILLATCRLPGGGRFESEEEE
ncbi:MAG: MnhB domain-containing protein [Planctomycetota bacterium]